MQVAAPGELEMAASNFRLGHALFGRASRAHIAGCEIQYARAVAHFSHAQQSAAASLLHIIRVGGDGEDVQVHGNLAPTSTDPSGGYIAAVGASDSRAKCRR